MFRNRSIIRSNFSSAGHTGMKVRFCLERIQRFKIFRYPAGCLYEHSKEKIKNIKKGKKSGFYGHSFCEKMKLSECKKMPAPEKHESGVYALLFEEKILVDVWKDGMFQARMILSKDDFATLENGKISSARISYTYRDWYRLLSLEMVPEWLSTKLSCWTGCRNISSTNTYYHVICSYQEMLANKKYLERKEKESHKFDREMKPVDKKTVPRKIQSFLEDKVFGDDYWYLFKKGETDGYCSYCGHFSDILFPLKHNQYTHCPHCGKKVRAVNKNITKNSRVVYKWLLLIERIHGVAWLRYFCCEMKQSITPEKSIIQVSERMRTSFYGKDRKDYEYRDISNNCGIYAWTEYKDIVPSYCRSVARWERPIHGVYVFPFSAKRAFDVEGIKYSGLSYYLPYVKQDDYMEDPYAIERYLRGYQTNMQCLEVFAKEGFFGVCMSLINQYSTSKGIIKNPTGKNLKEILGIDQERVRYLRQLKDPCISDVKYFQDMRFSMNELLTLRSLVDVYRSERYRDRIYPFLKRMTAHKLVKYVTEHVYPEDRLSDYLEYLEKTLKLGHALNDSTKYPKDFRYAYDFRYEEYEQNLDKMKKEKMERDAKRVHFYYQIRSKKPEYQYEDQQFLIKIPKDEEELIKEGDSLHHCVGRYAEHIADNKCKIFFVRTKRNPDKSFCTLELTKDNRFEQCHTTNNALAPKEVLDFVDGFIHHLQGAKKVS